MDRWIEVLGISSRNSLSLTHFAMDMLFGHSSAIVTKFWPCLGSVITLGIWRCFAGKWSENGGRTWCITKIFGNQIIKVVQLCFLQIRNNAKVKNFQAFKLILKWSFTDLYPLDLVITITWLVQWYNDHWTLDLMIKMLFVICLQLIQNYAARLLTSSKERYPISPFLASPSLATCEI